MIARRALTTTTRARAKTRTRKRMGRSQGRERKATVLSRTMVLQLDPQPLNSDMTL